MLNYLNCDPNTSRDYTFKKELSLIVDCPNQESPKFNSWVSKKYISMVTDEESFENIFFKTFML